MKTLKIILKKIRFFLNRYYLKIPLLIGITFYIFFFHRVDFYEVSLNKNYFTNEIVCDTNPGYKISPPWIQASVIDTRPLRVCIDCSCNALDCKLVSFNPKGYKEFVQKEGWGYYWWRNRLSINTGNQNEWRGMDNILRGYSFDGKKYEFLNK